MLDETSLNNNETPLQVALNFNNTESTALLTAKAEQWKQETTDATPSKQQETKPPLQSKPKITKPPHESKPKAIDPNNASQPSKVCDVCAITDAETFIDECACGHAFYCSKVCQAAGWSVHKADCERYHDQMKDDEEEAKKKKMIDLSCVCSGCGNSDAAVEKFPCGSCGQKKYCGRPCQRAHWKDDHKEECRAWCEANKG